MSMTLDKSEPLAITRRIY